MQSYFFDRLKRRHYKVCGVREKDFQLMDILTGEKTPWIPMITWDDPLLRPVGKQDIGTILMRELGRQQRQAKRLSLKQNEDYPPLTALKARIETYFRDALQLVG